MLKYIFGGIFVALAWALFIVFHQHVPLWVPILVTVLIAAGLVAWAIFKATKAKRAAARLEKALDDQARAQAGNIRPDQAAEIASMQAEFAKAVASLKASKLGKSGRDALGVLPWYVIIGPPGAGKTTALRNSGLKFPSGAKGGRVRGVGGTRNCDWWLTNEAIILDTAGRWSTEDDDKEEWLAFLDLLRKTRPKKPVNGIMVAVSVQELQAAEDDIAALAKTLRERIDEVVQRLDMVVPVYLLVTKCDLIPGFIETFGDLRDKERGEIWGLTLPLAAEQAERTELFGERLEELGQVIERRALARMGEERRVEAREKIYQFPQQFEALRQPLGELVSNLFTDSVYQDAPIMRGVYFTSGTQEGRPIDRVMSKMAEAFGVRPRMQAAAAPAKPKSYFVRDLFHFVVFPDQNVGVRSTRVLRRQRIQRMALTGLALAAAVSFLFLPITSYLKNRRFIAGSRAFVEKLAKLGRDVCGGTAMGTLESAEAMAKTLADFEADGSPDVSLRFGLWPGAALMDPLHQAVRALVVRPLVDGDVEPLTNFARGQGGADAAGALEGLTAHLLLTQPKAPDEPAPGADAWAGKWVPAAAEKAGARCAAMAGERATARGRRAVEHAVRFYALRVHEGGELLDRNTGMVRRLREALVGSGGDPVDDLIRDPSMPPPVRVIDLVGAAVTIFKGGEVKGAGPSVPGAFTPEGWEAVKKRLKRMADDAEDDEEAWVFGERTKRGALDVDKVRGDYFRRYVDSWKGFLLALSVKEPATIDEARLLIKTLATGNALESIWRNAKSNLVWKDESLVDDIGKRLQGKVAGKLAAARTKATGKEATARPAGGKERAERARMDAEGPSRPEDIGAEFAGFIAFGDKTPSGVESYKQTLAEVMGVLGEEGTPDGKAFAAAYKTSRVRISGLIAGYNRSGWEGPLLERILLPPLSGSATVVTGATGDLVNRKWCDSIVVPFEQLFAGRYPFDPRGTKEASLAEVQKFFHPQSGTLWTYFNESLKSDIEHPQGTTIFNLREGASMKYGPGLLKFLSRSQELTDFLFSASKEKMSVPLGVRIHPSPAFSKIVFEGSRAVNYFNTPERWETLEWPSPKALFRCTGKGGGATLDPGEGDWALFRLLDQGKHEVREDHVAAQWSTETGAVVAADFKPAKLFRVFRGFVVPRGAVAGAAACGK